MKVFILTAMLLISGLGQAQATPHLLMEVQDYDTNINLIQSISVTDDGKVTWAANGQSEVVASIASSELLMIQGQIRSLVPAPLVRLDPSQTFLPGAIAREFYVIKNGVSVNFAKYLRGVDFVLPNDQGQTLESILADFANNY